jgi:DNA-directed RNA polymerase subunit RPC12/RpoP
MEDNILRWLNRVEQYDLIREEIMKKVERVVNALLKAVGRKGRRGPYSCPHCRSKVTPLKCEDLDGGVHVWRYRCSGCWKEFGSYWTTRVHGQSEEEPALDLDRWPEDAGREPVVVIIPSDEFRFLVTVAGVTIALMLAYLKLS